MKKKKIFYTELAYVFGIVILALGTAFMERADFGMSMVVAPAYLIHLKVSQYLPWYTFGMSEYVLQFFILILLGLVLRKFKISYLFSFVTAVIYGFTLDFLMFLMDFIPFDVSSGKTEIAGGFIPFDLTSAGPALAVRFIYYIVGMLLCSLGVALLFHTYIAPEAYELFVKEYSKEKNLKTSVVKTVYDITSCITAVILSFLFFGFLHFEGVKIGTVFCALINGFLIGRISVFFESRYEFIDGLPLRKYFEK